MSHICNICGKPMVENTDLLKNLVLWAHVYGQDFENCYETWKLKHKGRDTQVYWDTVEGLEVYEPGPARQIVITGRK